MYLDFMKNFKMIEKVDWEEMHEVKQIEEIIKERENAVFEPGSEEHWKEIEAEYERRIKKLK